MPDLSADRNSILEQLKQAEDAAERLLSAKSREQANWQPNQGTSWSMWQCFDHLARINRVYCQALEAAVENPACNTRRHPAKGRARVVCEMVHQRHGATRAHAIQGTRKGDSDRGWRSSGSPQAFLASHAPVRHVLEFWDRVNFNRVRFKNPFVPLIRFTVGTGLMVINAHDRRHLWQAERVQDAPGFPKV